MNIFRRNLVNEELELKVQSYESQIKDLETGFAELKELNSQLSDQVQSLMEKLSEKETVIEEKTEEIEVITEKVEELEEVITEKEEEVQEKEELIQEVIDNTLTVEKRAAIKALEILADCGTEVVETIDPPKEVNLMESLKTLKGKELVEFYEQNRKAIFDKLKQ
jgi:chromosome segregation ATPase